MATDLLSIRSPLTAPSPAWIRHGSLAVVMIAATWAAAAAATSFWPEARRRWTQVGADANTDCAILLDLAQDVRRGDVALWWNDLDAARSWPPLHAFFGSIIQLAAARSDSRLAVAPSLFGWWATIVLSFLVARRVAPRGGDFAGLVAALFVIGSPSHRAFATDVMLESLGAALTLLVFWFYLRLKQEPSRWTARWFAVSLTALFLEKYQYWVLVAAPLIIVEGTPFVVGRLGMFKSAFSSATAERLASATRNPWNYVLAAILVFILWIKITGGAVWRVLGVEVDVRDAFNPLQAAALLVLLRVVGWWRSGGRRWLAEQDYRICELAYGHFAPLLVWFSLPKRLGFFLYYLTKRHTEAEYVGFLGGAGYYWRTGIEFYHLNFGLATAALCFFAGSLLSARRLRNGALLLYVFLAAAAVATILHPQKMSRCMHTWVAGFWILGGAGAGTFLFAPRRPLMVLNRMMAITVLGLLTLLQLPAAGTKGASTELYHNAPPEAPSVLAVSDFYLPLLTDAKHPLFLANLPMAGLANWTFVERYPDRPRIECFLRRFEKDADANRALFEKWLRETKTDAVVYVEADVKSPFYFHGFEYYRQYGELLSKQSVFHPHERRQFAVLGCTATIWRRGDPATAVSAEKEALRR